MQEIAWIQTFSTNKLWIFLMNTRIFFFLCSRKLSALYAEQIFSHFSVSECVFVLFFHFVFLTSSCSSVVQPNGSIPNRGDCTSSKSISKKIAYLSCFQSNKIEVMKTDTRKLNPFQIKPIRATHRTRNDRQMERRQFILCIYWKFPKRIFDRRIKAMRITAKGRAR